ncbi:MAG TPA: hypothetical protein VF789_10950 [Thermoanaerobaculia bacterium]
MKVKMLALALGLTALALTAPPTAAAPTCEAQCRANNGRCQQICRQNPCLISCEDQLRFCLAGCTAG